MNATQTDGCDLISFHLIIIMPSAQSTHIIIIYEQSRQFTLCTRAGATQKNDIPIKMYRFENVRASESIDTFVRCDDGE